MKDKQQPKITVNVQAYIAVGEYPEGHEKEGQFAIQVMIEPFSTRDMANLFADKNITPLIEKMMGKKALVTQ